MLAFSFAKLRHVASDRLLIVSCALATLEMLPATYYGRYLPALGTGSAVASLALSFLGTSATYLLLMALAQRRNWTRCVLPYFLAAWTVLLQVVYFGIYREFSTLPTVSIVDFARQAPEYAWALFVDRLSVLQLGAGAIAVYAMARALRWGLSAAPHFRSSLAVILTLSLGVGLSYAYSVAPFMTFGQQAIALVAKSSRGPGLVNTAWVPDRDQPSLAPALYPINVLIFRLEEIAAQATTLDRPDLPTTPRLKALIDQHSEEAFVGHQHFSNSTATDVSVLSIYTGLSPAADLEAHRHVPILWDYFAAAGYDTSLFLPYHLEWGDFKTRFNRRQNEVSLNKILDAGNSGRRIAYDNSINDVDVVSEALAYQRSRGWSGPFLQVVSLKMPHAIGEGARVNKLSYGAWDGAPDGLHDYYNGIRHDDELIHEFMAAIPQETRQRTVVVFLSDHGTRLFPRSDGAEELHRLDNYHGETTKVPFVIYAPRALQATIPGERWANLRRNLTTRATSNIDMLPTLLALAGIQPVQTQVASSELLQGRDLTGEISGTDAIVQLNSGALRRWDREHFSLVLDNGRFHYFFNMGRELLFDLQTDNAEATNIIASASVEPIAARARAISTEIPELFRIRQKYKPREKAGVPAVAVPSAMAPVNDLRVIQTSIGSTDALSKK